MAQPTLAVLAAGLGSRYGGLKQIDPVGPGGEIIIDYSLFDAARAGFKKVVFLVAPGMEPTFEEVIGRKVRGKMQVDYAVQALTSYVPEGFKMPEGRKKPWGTGHAILCCREKVEGPFCIINSDDYYGPDAFARMYAWLSAVDCGARPAEFSMVSYRVGNTVTDRGKVARGMCRTRDGFLVSVEECTHVVNTPDGPAYSMDGGATLEPLCYDSPVSMNFWGFTPAIFDALESRFERFLAARGNQEGSEFFIPSVVEDMLAAGECRVRVMTSADRWYGVTYREDKPDVAAALRAMAESGLYPEKLWD